MKLITLLLLGLWAPLLVVAQQLNDEHYKCGQPTHTDSLFTFKSKGVGWGYTYDSLVKDIHQWKQHASVTLDSIGASTQGRAIWMLTLTNTSIAKSNKIRISVHARTHPGEVQAQQVTNQMINQLLRADTLAKLLLDNCIFNFIPMINPDGVELGYARENANMIDIESNWSASAPEKEVLVLKDLYTQFMNTASPISIALNMHAAYDCKRYFVVHDAFGTSAAFLQEEQRFVNAIKNYLGSDLQAWNYMVTWKTSTPTYYPESFFWLNYGEQVMALTYEDMNCSTAGNYDKTASAFLNGMADYLSLKTFDHIVDSKPINTYAIHYNADTHQIKIICTDQQMPRLHQVQVYTINGQVIPLSLMQSDHLLTLQLPSTSSGLHLLRLNNQSFKVFLQ